uniref:PPUP8892 n=1 Tax=Poeciliopsis prolifica TaxID=188132 RepID=A0A0S7EK95_9TELE
MEAALSLRSLFCQPCATDQQSASQPCTDLIPLPLTPTISVSSYLALPLCQRPLPSPCLLPTPTACSLPTVHVCLATSPPACLLLCAPVSPLRLSVILPVLLSVGLSTSLSLCQSLPPSNIPPPESGQPVSRSANLPDYLPIYLSSVCVSICLPARLSAGLPVCPSICLSALLTVQIKLKCQITSNPIPYKKDFI